MGGTVTIVERKDHITRIIHGHSGALFDIQDYRYLEGCPPSSNGIVKEFQRCPPARPIMSYYGMLIIDFDTKTITDLQWGGNYHSFYDAALRLSFQGRISSTLQEYFKYALEKGAVQTLRLYSRNSQEEIPVPAACRTWAIKEMLEWQEEHIQARLQNNPEGTLITPSFDYSPPDWSYQILGEDLANKENLICLGKTLLDMDIDVLPYLSEFAADLPRVTPLLEKEVSEALVAYAKESLNAKVPTTPRSSLKRTL